MDAAVEGTSGTTFGPLVTDYRDKDLTHVVISIAGARLVGYKRYLKTIVNVIQCAICIARRDGYVVRVQ